MIGSLQERWTKVHDEVERVCLRHGRSMPTLIAVSKRHPAEAIRACYELGQRDFGENYAQELVTKAEALNDLEDIRWHMIGPLQRNKARHLAPHTPVIHTLNSVRLIKELDRRATTSLQGLIQVNLAGEEQKSGVSPDELEELLLYAETTEFIRISGLMLIPPRDGDAPSWFRKTRELAQRWSLSDVSMGMSADYAQALAEGSTMIRVGSAIFGPRPE